MPHVSAILLCYNCADLVAAAVRSLLAQDYAGPAEVIVSDDASPDGTFDTACSELVGCRADWTVKTFQRAANSGSKSAHLNDVLPRGDRRHSHFVRCRRRRGAIADQQDRCRVRG